MLSGELWILIYSFLFLADGNKTWCKNAGVLLIGISKKNADDGKPNPTHSLDIGSAWENLALQATQMSLVTHGMAGYSTESVRKELNISEEFEINLMIAVGKPGKVEDLPEYLQVREKPNDRKKLFEIVFEGKEGAKMLK